MLPKTPSWELFSHSLLNRSCRANPGQPLISRNTYLYVLRSYKVRRTCENEAGPACQGLH